MAAYRRYIILLTLFFACGVMVPSWADISLQQDSRIHWLTLTDIHFDPFASCNHLVPCPLVLKLNRAEVKAWPSLLARYDTVLRLGKQDTTYPLLKLTLAAAKNVAMTDHAELVWVLGDFLGHNYRENYIKYTHDRSRVGYQLFVQKTLGFLTNTLAATFPSLDVYPLVGNNDSYRADYESDPHGPFFKNVGLLWSSLIKNPKNKVAMQKEFSLNGYYAVTLFNNSVRLIVLNTNFFSYKAKGAVPDKAANEELNWLHNELQLAKDHHQKVFIAMHIPMSIDIYTSLRLHFFSLLNLWRLTDIQRFELELQQFAPEIAGVFAGHLHVDGLQMLNLSKDNKIPLSVTPAVSPIFATTPGFKTFTYSLTSQRLTNSATYYYPFNAKTMLNRSMTTI